MSLIHDTSNAVQTLRLLDNFGIAAMICDNDGVVQLLNNSAAALFGDEPGRLEGHSLREMDDFAALLPMLEKPQPQIAPVVLSVMDSLYCLVRMQRIGKIGVVFTFEDITSFKEIEQQQNAALHMVAHDLKTPLSAIKSYSDLVGASGGLNDRQLQHLDRIQQAIRTMHGLVKDLLDIAWIDAGHPVETEPVQVGYIVKAAAEVLENHADKRQIVIDLSIDEELPQTYGDPQRLERVMVNLVGNAIKYTPIGGTIAIQTSANSESIIITIKDSGAGIPTEHLPHIFKRFYRVPNNEDADGTGLGLSIAKAIVERHGGDIKVTSTVGQGSTFIVTLPIRNGPRATSEE
ncbi:MAG: PAS domain-containing protein [Chloroflexi bacterium]|nr:PAS domain-containing protein [Chloroflexota bacterium]